MTTAIDTTRRSMLSLAIAAGTVGVSSKIADAAPKPVSSQEKDLLDEFALLTPAAKDGLLVFLKAMR